LLKNQEVGQHLFETNKRHEEKHARNYALKRALRNLAQSITPEAQEGEIIRDPHWGLLIGFLNYQAAGQLDDQVDSQESTPEKVISSEAFQDLIRSSVTEAKDELVAAMGTPGQTVKHYRDTVLALGIYDPLRWHRWKSPELDRAYRSQYETILKENTAGIGWLEDQYRWYPDFWVSEVIPRQLWEKRRAILSPTFAQIPIWEWGQWAEVGSPFHFECQQCLKFFEESQELIECFWVTREWKGMELGEEEAQVAQEATELRKEFEEHIFENSDQLMIEKMVTFNKRLTTLITKLDSINPQRLAFFRSHEEIIDFSVYLEQEAMEKAYETESDEWKQVRKEAGQIPDELGAVFTDGPSEELFERLMKRLEEINQKLEAS